MIAFDLRCGGAHVFEAWFRSSSDYETQSARQLIQCPVCGDHDVGKAVMAPNIGRKGNQAVVGKSDTARHTAVPAVQTAAPAMPAPLMTGRTLPPEMIAMAAAIAKAQADALPRSTWVGGDFATQARAMHRGEQDASLIHGQTSPAEAEALVDEGVAIMPLLVPVIPPELQN